MESIIKSIYKGMLGPKKEFFLMKFVIMYERKKDKQWDLLRKMRLTNFKKYKDRLDGK
jgi:hypothetical protein